MAKNKNNNNDLFSNFKAPNLNQHHKIEEVEKKVEKETYTLTPKEDQSIEKDTSLNFKEEDIIPEIDKPTEVFTEVDPMPYAIPRSGRPKTVEGKYHTYTARLREELYDYAYSQVGRHKQFQSVNDYINQLIAKDMLSKKNKKTTFIP